MYRGQKDRAFPVQETSTSFLCHGRYPRLAAFIPPPIGSLEARSGDTRAEPEELVAGRRRRRAWETMTRKPLLSCGNSTEDARPSGQSSIFPLSPVSGRSRAQRGPSPDRRDTFSVAPGNETIWKPVPSFSIFKHTKAILCAARLLPCCHLPLAGPPQPEHHRSQAL
ncbi:unnamed protein product [Arctogadus glacialis]